MSNKTDQVDMTITTMRIPTDDYLAIQEAAGEDDRSVSALMRRTVRDYVEQRRQ